MRKLKNIELKRKNIQEFKNAENIIPKLGGLNSWNLGKKY